ncbi:TraR/DksA family transcriptional regulator [Streptomyces sp. NPDC002133]|uniref:TraR/DksA family transcriptional regulator n=1 Tax=Streptomyces sp. NPDC002133 TaxID=3154409 RepID=UPI0033326CA3
MVAKKTAVKKTASARSTAAAGAAAKDTNGKKSIVGKKRNPATGRVANADASGANAHDATEVKAAAAVGKAAKKATATRTKKVTAAKKTAAPKGTAVPKHSAAAKDSPAAKDTAPAAETTAAKETAKKSAKPAKTGAKAATATRKSTTPAKKAGTAERKEPAGRSTASTEAAAAKAPARTKRAAAARTTGAGARKAARAAKEAAEAAKQTGARTVGAKKTAASATAGGDGIATGVPPARVVAATAPEELAVRPGEDPWTPDEVAEARAELESEMAKLRDEINHSEEALTGLMRDSGDGAGDDQADTGAKNITREHEIALANNAREMLEQTERALHRLDTGTYGLCEICGKPIGKARMQAFPRATLCVEDKQKQERRA